ncbi:MAG: DUF6766 family protein [Verrucomicrobiota bacterium]
MKRIFRENGLSIVLFTFFLVFLFVGQSLTGHREHNRNQREHGEDPISFGQYVLSADFLEATMENWESEFLQMFVYVILTACLYQKGSAESKDPHKKSAVDAHARSDRPAKNAPWPVRKGGWILRLYEQSLALAFLILFLGCFVLHAAGGVNKFNDELKAHGESPLTTMQYFGTSRFWFESFQNWQSEFLAIGSMVVLSIWLRQRGSPESKPVSAAHSDTGGRQ